MASSGPFAILVKRSFSQLSKLLGSAAEIGGNSRPKRQASTAGTVRAPVVMRSACRVGETDGLVERQGRKIVGGDFEHRRRTRGGRARLEEIDRATPPTPCRRDAGATPKVKISAIRAKALIRAQAERLAACGCDTPGRRRPASPTPSPSAEEFQASVGKQMACSSASRKDPLRGSAAREVQRDRCTPASRQSWYRAHEDRAAQRRPGIRPASAPQRCARHGQHRAGHARAARRWRLRPAPRPVAGRHRPPIALPAGTNLRPVCACGTNAGSRRSSRSRRMQKSSARLLSSATISGKSAISARQPPHRSW